MNLEMNQQTMSQRDQDHPSLFGSSLSLTRCFMAHQEVLLYQLNLSYGYSPQRLRSNSDSQTLMVDDGASPCITNDKNDSIGTPKPISRKANGINGQAQTTHRGTVRWFIKDDEGVAHVFTITGACLVPTASTRILSPQHLAQQAQDHYPRAEGMGSTTLSKNIMLFWNQRKHTKTVPLDHTLNVGLTTTAAGAKMYK